MTTSTAPVVYTLGSKRAGPTKWEFQLQQEKGGRKKALTGWKQLDEKQQKKLAELLAIANCGQKVHFARAYAMFPQLKKAK